MGIARAARNNRLVWWLSIQAGLSSLAGAAIMADILGLRLSALFLAITSALQVGTAAYVAQRQPVNEIGQEGNRVG